MTRPQMNVDQLMLWFSEPKDAEMRNKGNYKKPGLLRFQCLALQGYENGKWQKLNINHDKFHPPLSPTSIEFASYPCLF